MVEQDITIYRGLTFGPFLIYATDSLGAPYDLTGWTSHASVKKRASGPEILDLSPTITNAAIGESTIELTKVITLNLNEAIAYWDFVLETPAGKLLGPFIRGVFTVTTPMTQP